jgi:C_GCAxxG_C_C family probable redox protein
MTKKTSRRKFICSASALAAGFAAFRLDETTSQIKKKSKEEIHKQLDELVDKNLPIFGTCSQTSFKALNDTFNLKAEKVVKALASFPGIALRGETCGAVSGCLCGIALIYETDKPGNKLSRKPSYEFCSRFESEFGTTRCRDVIEHMSQKKYSISKPGDYALPSKEGAISNNNCGKVIKKALDIAAEIIIEKA